MTKSDPRYQEVGENMATPSQVEAAPLVLTAQLDTLESLLSSLADARSALDPLFSAFAAGPSSSASSLIAGDGHGPPALPPVGALGGAQKQKQWREAVVGAVEAVGKLKTSVQGSQCALASLYVAPRSHVDQRSCHDAAVLQATQESAKQDPNHIVVSPPGPRLPAPKSTSRSRRRIRAPLPARDPSPRTEDELDATLRSYEGLEVEKVAERRRGGKDFQVVVKVPGVMRVLLDLRWRTSSEDMTEDDGRVVVIERGNCFALHEGEVRHLASYAGARLILTNAGSRMRTTSRRTVSFGRSADAFTRPSR